MDDYLVKPIRAEELKNAITRIVQKKQKQQELLQKQQELEAENMQSRNLVETEFALALIKGEKAHLPPWLIDQNENGPGLQVSAIRIALKPSCAATISTALAEQHIDRKSTRLNSSHRL